MLALVLGIVAVWSPYLVHWKLGLNSDSAVPVLMARKILDGDRPFYFWGAEYMGAIDSYLAAGVLAVFGRDLVFVSYLPQLLSYALGAVLLVQMAPAGERGPRAFLLLFAPPGLFMAIVRCSFSQDPLLWLALAAVIALRPGLQPEPRSDRAHLQAACAGVVLALATFRIPTSLVALPLLSALVVLCAWIDWRADRTTAAARIRARLIQLLAVVALAQLYRLAELIGGGEANMQVSVDLARFWHRARALGQAFLQFDPSARFGVTTSGLYTFYSGLPLAEYRGLFDSLLARSVLGWTVTAGILTVVATGAWRIAVSALRELRAVRIPDVHALYFVGLLVAVCVGLLVQTRFFETGGWRYLTTVFFSLVVCASAAIARLSRPVQLALALVWLAMVGVGHARRLVSEDRVIADLERANGYVLEHGIDAGVGDIWLGYVNTVLSNERLVIMPEIRGTYPPYVRLVQSRRRLAALEFCPFDTTHGRPRRTIAASRALERRAFGAVCVTLLERVE
jgi:hypothetical protein